MVRKQYLDDLEIDEEGVGDILLDENSTVTVARPGTSFQRPMSSRDSEGASVNPIMRPTSSRTGRPMSGYARPGSNRPTSSSNQRVETALQGNRPGTNRPITAGGRYMRLGTASLQQMGGGQFIDASKLNVKSLAKKKSLAKAVCDYLIYVDHNPKKALELAAEATVVCNYNDWWWKARLGKCYYMLGLYREAEKQFSSSLKNEDIIKTHLELARVYVRLDQPMTAIEIFNSAVNKYPQEIAFLLGVGRIYDMLNDSTKASEFYKKVLQYESSNLEAVACIASHHFYIDQPEVSLRFYKRLVQLGVNSAELWNNMALCCFYDAQYDMFFTCFEKALQLSDDTNKADIWYNISHIFLNNGDIPMVTYCLKLALAYDPHHAESYNNMGVLELKKNNIDGAKFNFNVAMKEGEFLFEAAFNGALAAFKSADYQECYKFLKKALGIYPEHAESKELLKTIEELLNII